MDAEVRASAPGPHARAQTPSFVSARRISVPFSERRLLLSVVDSVLVSGAVLAALLLWSRTAQEGPPDIFVQERWFWFPILVGIWWLMSWLFDLYDVPVAARRLDTWRRLGILVLVFVLAYLVVYFVLPRDTLPRLFFLFFAGIACASVALWRWSYATLFALPVLRTRLLIVGAGWAGQELAELLSKEAERQYQIVGFVDDDPEKQGADICGVPVLGTAGDLTQIVQAYKINNIALAITHGLHGTLFQGLVDCQARGVSVVRMPKLYEDLTRRVPVEHINEGWVLDALNGFSGLSRLEQATRRVLDLIYGSVGLLVLVILLPFVALAVSLDDRGPLFYRQTRAGLGNKPFRVLKLRTMRCDAEADGRPRWAQDKDDRITRVGRFLRKTRLDELPQVLNVLRGEMSFVGPRPERPEFIADLEKQIPFYRTRLVVKPGITGWAQIRYEYGNSVEDALIKLQYDLYYIRHRSIWLDLYIVFNTIGVSLLGRGM